MTVVNSEEGLFLTGYHLRGKGHNFKVKHSTVQWSFSTKVNKTESPFINRLNHV